MGIVCSVVDDIMQMAGPTSLQHEKWDGSLVEVDLKEDLL